MSKHAFKWTQMALAVSTAFSTMAISHAGHACTPNATSSTFTVNVTHDISMVDVETTLREAIEAANGSEGCDIINFDIQTPGTIILDGASNGSLAITDDLNIHGPGSGALTITQSTEGLDILRGFDAGLSMSGVTLSGAPSGNGLTVYTDSEGVNLDDVIIENNASEGLVIFGDSGTDVVISNSRISNNVRGLGVSGGLASLEINQSIISSNVGSYGSGGVDLYVGSDTKISIRDTLITGNESTGEGGTGGIYLFNGGGNVEVSIIDSVISNNKANQDSGGMTLYSSTGELNVTLVRTAIAGNTYNGNGNGGGMRVASNSADVKLNIIDSTISGNQIIGSSGNGGGLAMEVLEGGTMGAVIQQSTFSDNSSPTQGGAIHISGEKIVSKIEHSTFTNNKADVGGGIFNSFSAVTLNNTIVAGNSAVSSDADLYGAFSTSYSFIGTDSANATITDLGGSIKSGGNPDLGALSGLGKIQVHIPNSTSPVINAGDPSLILGSSSVPSLDQRGKVRVNGTQIDIGSVEYHSFSSSSESSSTSNSSSNVSSSSSLGSSSNSSIGISSSVGISSSSSVSSSSNASSSASSESSSSGSSASNKGGSNGGGGAADLGFLALFGSLLLFRRRPNFVK